MPINSNGIEIKVTTTEEGSAAAANEIKKVTEQTKAVGEASTKSDSAFGGLLDRFVFSIDPISLVTQGIGLLKQVLMASIDAFAEAEVVDAQVNAVLQSTGGIAGVTAEAIDDLATRLSKLSGVDDEAIKRGEALMLTFTKVGSDVFPQATEAALNMSMAMGTDLQSSIIQVGKALNDPIQGASALRRVGVQLTDQQEEQVKAFMETNDIASAQAIILNELKTEFGGIAEMMGDTVTGSSNKLKVAWGNLLETMGEGNAGVYQENIEQLTEIVETQTDLVRVQALGKQAVESGLITQLEYNRMENEAVLTKKTLVEVEQELNDMMSNSELSYVRIAASLRDVADATTGVVSTTAELEVSMDVVKAGIQGVVGDAYDKYTEKLDDLQGKHADLTSDLATLQSQGWQPTSEKIQDVTEKIRDNEAAQLDVADAMQEAITKMIFQQASAGLDADAQLALARAMGVLDEESYIVATATQSLRKQFDDGKISADEYARRVAELRDNVNSLKDKSITITVNEILRTQYGAAGFNQGELDLIGKAQGTEGWETVPPGYPDDSYPIGLTTGEKFAVVPAGTSQPSMSGGGFGGSPIMINITVASPVTIMDEQNAQNVLLPYIIEGLNQARAQGANV